MLDLKQVLGVRAMLGGGSIFSTVWGRRYTISSCAGVVVLAVSPRKLAALKVP